MSLPALLRHRAQRRGLVVVTILLGIALGATAAVAALMDALLLRPLPIGDLNRVVTLGGLAYGPEIGDPLAWWGRADGLERLAIYRVGDGTRGNGEPPRRWIRTAEVSPDFFRVFGLPPVIGRDFLSSDDHGTPAAIVSVDMWRSEFGASAPLAGKRIVISGVAYDVVGVVSSGFDFPSGATVWVVRRPAERPVTLVAGASADSPPTIRVGWVGRLRPRASVDQVRTQLRALLNAANTKLTPLTGVRFGDFVSVRIITETLTRNVELTVRVIGAGAGFILATALLNCVLFLLARVRSRRLETAVAQALGASRRQIVHQVLTESSQLGILSGCTGAAVALVLLEVARRSLPAIGSRLPTHTPLVVIALGVAFGVGALAGLCAGVIPAFQAARDDIASVLNERAGVAGTRGYDLLRRVVVGLEVTVAVALVTGTIVTARAMQHLASAPPGVDLTHTLSIRFAVPREAYNTDARFAELHARLLGIAHDLPAVTSAVIVNVLPVFSRDKQFLEVYRDEDHALAAVTNVAGDYVTTFGLPVTRGRPPSPDEPFGVLISERLFRTLWKGADPIGQRIRLADSDMPWTVTGIAEDTTPIDQSDTVALELYRGFPPPDSGTGSGVGMWLAVRCADDCAAAAARAPIELRAVSDVTVSDVRPSPDFVTAFERPVRVRTSIWTMYSVVGLGIALLGVYALIAFSIGSRSAEIGLRLAVGCSRPWAAWLLFSDSLVTLIVATLVGGALSFANGRLLSNLIFGVESPSFKIVAGAAGCVFLATAIASLAPALWLLRLEPKRLLHSHYNP